MEAQQPQVQETPFDTTGLRNATIWLVLANILTVLSGVFAIFGLIAIIGGVYLAWKQRNSTILSKNKKMLNVGLIILWFVILLISNSYTPGT